MLAERRVCAGGANLQCAFYAAHRSLEGLSLPAPHLLYCGVLAGRIVAHPPAGDAFVVAPGDSLVLPRGQGVHVDLPEACSDAPTTCLTVALPPRTVRRVAARLDSVPSLPPDAESESAAERRTVHFGTPPAIQRELETIATLLDEAPPHRDVLVDLHATALVVRLLRTRARPFLRAPGASRAAAGGLAAAVAHVHRHLDRHIPVSELAEAACMSESTFYRAFRANFGRTPHEYITLARMRRAEQLLRDPNRSVTEVSYEIGFRSVSHFIKTFKQHAGNTPRAYQRARKGEVREGDGCAGDGQEGEAHGAAA
jgi:AraC-like DNA-binding protein